MTHPRHPGCTGVTRRQFLADTGMGFTGLALGALLFQDGIARGQTGDNAAPDGRPHFEPRAKSVIWIFLCGGVSHVESFDVKPELNRYNGVTIDGTPYRDALNPERLRDIIGANPAHGGRRVLMGLNTGGGSAAETTKKAQDAVGAVFNISALSLLPLLLLVILSLRQVPPFLAIFGTAILSCAFAAFAQPNVVRDFVGKPEQGAVLTAVEAAYKAMGQGFVLKSGNETIDALFSRGGMSGMLTTVWLIFGALSFAAVMDKAHMIGREIGRGKAHRNGDRNLCWTEHRRGRPVRRRRPAEPRLPRCIRAQRIGSANAFTHGRGCRHGHVAACPVEQLRGLYDGRPRRFDAAVPALLLLQHREPFGRTPVWYHRAWRRASVFVNGWRGSV